MTGAQAPAGWHPDPRGRHEHRYWDGVQWTDHVADAGQVSTDPVDAPPVAPVQPEPEPQPDPEPVPARQQPREDAHAREVKNAPAAVAPAERSPDLAALLSIAAPGAGHFYLGGDERRRTTGLLLLSATIVAVIVAYFSFGLWLLGLAIWLAAAAYALFDLRAGLTNLRGARLSAQVVGWVLALAGGALIVSLLLPWYHVHVTVRGRGGLATNASGFESLGIIDLILLVIGAASLVSGLAALGKGPISSRDLPPAMPRLVTIGGVIAAVLVYFRMLVDPADGIEGFGVVDVSIGRAPGILLAGAASIAIAVAGASVLRTTAPAPATE